MGPPTRDDNACSKRNLTSRALSNRVPSPGSHPCANGLRISARACRWLSTHQDSPPTTTVPAVARSASGNAGHAPAHRAARSSLHHPQRPLRAFGSLVDVLRSRSSTGPLGHLSEVHGERLGLKPDLAARPSAQFPFPACTRHVSKALSADLSGHMEGAGIVVCADSRPIYDPDAGPGWTGVNDFHAGWGMRQLLPPVLKELRAGFECGRLPWRRVSDLEPRDLVILCFLHQVHF